MHPAIKAEETLRHKHHPKARHLVYRHWGGPRLDPTACLGRATGNGFKRAPIHFRLYRSFIQVVSKVRAKRRGLNRRETLSMF